MAGFTNLSNLIAYGAVGDRPAAGIPGRVYITSDTNQVFRDNGSTWDEVYVSASGGTTILETQVFS